jgi:hypothetical protein
MYACVVVVVVVVVVGDWRVVWQVGLGEMKLSSAGV